MDNSQLATACSALGHPIRLRILRTLASVDSSSIKTLSIDLCISHALTSQHVGVLEKSKLVSRQRRGREHLVLLNQKHIDQVADLITILIRPAPAATKHPATRPIP